MTNSPNRASSKSETAENDERRDFLLISTTTLSLAGVGIAVWPFISSINPAKDVLALASTEVDLSAIEVGQAVTVLWRGKPVFIRHRSEEEIKMARDVDINALPDPQNDEDRVQKAEWLVMVGVCTHLGCIPSGQNLGDKKGDFGGWFCPCHGSHYDTAGRVRKGPAPFNLSIPGYSFIDDQNILIG